VDNSHLIGEMKSLEAGLCIIVSQEPVLHHTVSITEKGMVVLNHGTPEFNLYSKIHPEEGAVNEELKSNNEELYKEGFGFLMKVKALRMDKKIGKVFVADKDFKDTIRNQLESISAGQNIVGKEFENLEKRGFVTTQTFKGYIITKGPQYNVNWSKPESELTSEMIIDGSWENKTFKPYNFDSLGLNIESGYLHPLMKVREEFRRIFMELGFEEMPTDKFVESSFWNFDSLFQPQQHSVRDLHDTFYLKTPKTTLDLPQDYVEKVKDIHENGGYGSIGWRYNWSEEEGRKNILRTHTTAISSRMLYKLAQEGFKPKKYFSIDRVYRNEKLDQTHLAEFFQCEGLVADYNLSLRDLMGMLETFYHKIGIKKLRFKPAYNPYTEPSMEVFGYHDGLGKWIEVGNSGVFRPEMLRPMGLPEDVTVIAWGLSLERPTMIKYGYDNIRELVGYSCKISFIQKNPMCRFDKE